MQSLSSTGLACALGLSCCVACFHLDQARGDGEPPLIERPFSAADVALSDGYRIELVAKNLTFPTSVTFDDSGRAYVVEAGYCYGEACAFPQLLRIEGDGSKTLLLQGRNGPWTGAVYDDGGFYIAEGGEFQGGRILRFENGRTRILVGYLPSIGDHHTNGPAIGPDGKIYFSIGSATNSGVVGLDNAAYGWLKRYPDFHDVPCQDVVLSGANFETDDLPDRQGARKVRTGAYLPFGTPSEEGQRIDGRIPCTGALFRIAPSGGEPELVAWGFRNPFGIAFGPDGRLYVADSGFDERGSRPVFGAADPMWRVEPGTWYGFPDFAEGRPVFDKNAKTRGKNGPRRLLQAYPNTPPAPVANFAVHSSSTGLDFSRSEAFGFVGQAFVAQFGDLAGATGGAEAKVGFKIVRVDPSTGVIADFAVNRGSENGPASMLGSAGLERPIAVRFDREGRNLYVVDFGIMMMDTGRPHPRKLTGALFRISRTGTRQ